MFLSMIDSSTNTNTNITTTNPLPPPLCASNAAIIHPNPNPIPIPSHNYNQPGIQMEISGSSRKRKRGVGGGGGSMKAFGFRTFADPGCPADFDGPFKENVRAFLASYAERELYSVEGRPAWSLTLQEETSGAHFSLFIIEESVHTLGHPHCDHCRCIGWSHHLVSNSRFHFVIPGPELSEGPLGCFDGLMGGKICPNCHDPLSPPILKCPTCGEDAVQGSILDLQSHLLHGMLHANGFGHLLSVNGRERGSKYVSGRDIMDLWDRICAMLRARKVSVEDVAKKRTLELRLLHSVAYGEPWFGRWGYRFGHGSFGTTQQVHGKAIEAIRGIPLGFMLQQFEGVDQEVETIVNTYQRISGNALETVGDLVQFMMELKARLPLSSPKSSNTGGGRGSQKDCSRPTSSSSSSTSSNTTLSSGSSTSTTTTNTITDTQQQQHQQQQQQQHSVERAPCRWSAKRLELATQVIVEALKSSEKKWMPRQDVRDAARIYIGDTGLLDFVLKSLGNRVVGCHVVRRAVNPITKVLEYSLEDLTPNTTVLNTSTLMAPPLLGSLSSSTQHLLPPNQTNSHYEIGRAEVLRDIVYVYKHVLYSFKPARRSASMQSNTSSKSLAQAIPTAAGIILDTKHFIKDYKGEITRRCACNEWDMDDDEMLRILCTVLLKNESEEEERRRPSPPPELIVLPPHATIGDLKREAQRAFQDTYYIMRGFRVESIVGLEGCGEDDDDELLFGRMGSGCNVVVQGSNADMQSELRYEGGNDSWVVDCLCGAKDDDGERMIACDVCEVWQHTRCGGISDLDSIPHRFLCHRCEAGLFQALL